MSPIVQVAKSYSSSPYSSSSGISSTLATADQSSSVADFFLILLFITLGILVFAAFIYATYLFVNLAKEKGVKYTSGLWFVGICATPIALGIYVACLPDKSNDNTPDNSVTASTSTQGNSDSAPAAESSAAQN